MKSDEERVDNRDVVRRAEGQHPQREGPPPCPPSRRRSCGSPSYRHWRRGGGGAGSRGRSAVCFAALSETFKGTTKYGSPYWKTHFQDRYGSRDFMIWADDPLHDG